MIRPLALALAVLASALPAAAQTTQTPPPAGVEFLSRFAFHVSMEHLFSEEERFVWDAKWGGELDLVDYGAGRFTFVANYQTILGSEFRAFDPNQGNYVLEGSLSARLPPSPRAAERTLGTTVEVAGVFHHVSRHLSDRPKRHPVDWNMVGGRIRAAMRGEGLDLEGRADVRGVVQRTFVDYVWEVDSDGRARVRIRPRVALVAAGGLRVVGVDDSRGRGTQYGARGEGGVRLEGRGAALELFVAAERRIDPYQLEFSTATWLTTGFRLSTR
ncbi:MAG: hypothetical protein HY657_00575 [Acidobacteria bacterium]|nr:hypothetical protein [Acidobacteriota bacterium]